MVIYKDYVILLKGLEHPWTLVFNVGSQEPARGGHSGGSPSYITIRLMHIQDLGEQE